MELAADPRLSVTTHPVVGGPTVGPSLNARLGGLSDYPFTRLAALLVDVTPRSNTTPLMLSIGEPQHEPPALLAQALAAAPLADWGKYPPTIGTAPFRAAVHGWLCRRYGLPASFVDVDKGILPATGTREALFQVALLATPQRKDGRQPAVLIPNPFYAVYEGAAALAGAEPVFMPATRETGFLPDLDALSPDLLARTALMYLCTPSNPQGAVADLAYLKKAITLARAYGFVLALDECYAEIWDKAPPPGGFEAALALENDGAGQGQAGQGTANLLVFNSLSKRSSAAGLRSGFIAGDPALIQAFTRLRSYALAGNALPALAAAAALWGDDAHVEENRRLYRQKIDAAEAALKGRYGFYRPAGGFFLWLEVGDGEAATRKLWGEAGVRVLPGAYFTRSEPDGSNAGRPFIRVALVHDTETVARACETIARVLG
ncbi:aminotransferase class I/II-fold pyridoxal phosphate-dependent enzyme [Nitrospirillum viridazoti]|uniref:Aspartate aminotransferase n=1 Tax=Nitrospirillum viridazoti CBAmc TaxID=1441467 RepID=A0A248JLA1_9PROT|nr:aminotransferase class I/II-fold pyridoxal phosphate-dependent enzyme [Nitrospirillum amazonense]ASG19449.1 aspartate aminotransferase [Nitrospirillum amazonense CBAmc]TWB42040.1 aspartate/methionine/tyrosine aminotransferase [Nitrospirillum amazonense]